MTQGLVRTIKAQWRVTDHVLDRLGDRGVAATELLDLLLDRGTNDRQFDVDESGKPLFCRWNDHIGIVYIHAPDWDTGDNIKLVLSVYVNGSGKDNWEKDAVTLAGKRREMQVISLDDMHDWALDQTSRGLPKRKKNVLPKVAPVVTSNRYDEVPPRLMETARLMLRASGLDENDMRPVVILGRGRIEIDPTRVKRLKRAG